MASEYACVRARITRREVDACVCVCVCVAGQVQVRNLVRGSEVTCGVVSRDTRIVFRSRSASVFWLIQLSSEMWRFDDMGDLYCERAVRACVRLLGSRAC